MEWTICTVIWTKVLPREPPDGAMGIVKASGFTGERSIVLPDPITADLSRAPLAGALFLSCIGFYPQARYHFRERRHGAPENILIYCIGGAGWYQLHGERHAVQKDQFFTLPGGVGHSYGADESEPWTIYWVHFGGERSGEFAVLPDAGGGEPRTIAYLPERIRLFDEMFEVLSMGYGRENLLYVNTCLWHFLGSFTFPDAFARIRNSREETAIDRIINVMKRDLAADLDLHGLTRASGLSRSHLSSRFRQATGYSPMQYFTHLRIQRACQLLDHTTMEVKEISGMLGFSDALYFSRVFTKVMNMSPTRYRRRQKG